MKIEQKRLYRSREDKVLAGVCGGLGEYLDIDPVLIRVAWVAMALLKGFGILLYLVWIFVVPLKPYVEEVARKQRRGGIAGILFGSALIFLGVIFLADEWHWIDLHWWGGWSWDYVFPVLLMGAGAWLLVRSREKREQTEEPVKTGEGQTHSEKAGPQTRRFVRDQESRKIFGVCGGIGRYLGVDATIIRLLFVIITLMNPPIGILAYLALAIFTPAEQVNGNRTAGSQAS